MTIPLRPFPFHGDAVTAVVTTRHGGVSTGVYDSLNLGDHVGDDPAAVRENRRRLAQALGVERLTVGDQKHGNRVAVIGPSLAGRGHDGGADSAEALPGTDAMVTNLPGVALATLVADCAPVVLFDPVTRSIGVAHCGRLGTVRGTLPATVDAMRDAFGTRTRDLRAGIGPAIGAASYEIGSAEAEQVTEAFGPDAADALLRPTRPGHATFDLVGALCRQLCAAGVPEPNVDPMGIDTRVSTDDFFSDRAARPCGRFMAVAVLRLLSGTRWSTASGACEAGRVRTTSTRREAHMEAAIGDHICLRGNAVGHPDKHGEIVEIRGSRGEPPYLVRFPDGQTRLMFPGPDAIIEHVPTQRLGD